MKNVIVRITLLILLACMPALLPFVKTFLPEYTTYMTAYKVFFISPFLFFAVIAFLGLRLNQTRIFYSMALMTLLYLSLHFPAISILQNFEYTLFLTIFFLFSILTFLLIFAFDEGALFSIKSLIRATGILFTGLGSYGLVKSNMGWIPSLFSKQWLISLESWTLPDLFWPITIIAVFLLLFKRDKSIHPFKVALILSFITLMLAFNKSILTAEPDMELNIYNAFAFNIIGVISLYSVYKIYWQNVYIDELTGIPNRRAFNEQLKKLGRRFTIAMLDIDHFKKFNDTYGHTEGDNVLRYVAAHLDAASDSRVFRYGGEEFSIVYPGFKVNDVYWRLEQMREGLASRRFHIRMNETQRLKKSDKDRGKNVKDGKKVRVTISIGIAQRTEKFRKPEEVIEAADKALYSAKKKGRNQCVVKRA